MDRARRHRLAWLLHIDIDELFFSPDQTPAQYFDWAESRKLNSILHLNYEAVPEKIEIGNPFHEVDLFKVPLALLPAPASPSPPLF